MNYLDLAPEDRPDLPTRERMAGTIEVACPVCGHWRQGFLLEPLDEIDAAQYGVDWACDAERTAWARDAAPPPAEERQPISALDFIGLFTLTEQLAAYASDDPTVRLAIGQTQAAGIIHLDDPRVADGLDLLVSVGIITAERAAEIIAGTPPPAGQEGAQ